MDDAEHSEVRVYSPIRTSAQTDKLDVAMAAAQAELENPTKNQTAKVEGTSKSSGKAYSIGYAYTDIAGLLAACRPVLGAHGIAIYQVTVIAPGASLMIVTRLSHAGQWIESDYPVCKIGGDHQDMGSAMTYARRYALGAMVGVAPEKDTDGAGASPAYAPDRSSSAPKSVNTVLQAFIAAMKLNKTVEDVDAWAAREANAITEKLSRRDQDDMQAAYATHRKSCEPAQVATEPEDKPKTEAKPTAAAKSLADRAALFESAMRACTEVAPLQRVYEQGAKLRQELDKVDPERMAELDALYLHLVGEVERKPTASELISEDEIPY